MVAMIGLLKGDTIGQIVVLLAELNAPEIYLIPLFVFGGKSCRYSPEALTL